MHLDDRLAHVEVDEYLGLFVRNHGETSHELEPGLAAARHRQFIGTRRQDDLPGLVGQDQPQPFDPTGRHLDPVEQQRAGAAGLLQQVDGLDVRIAVGTRALLDDRRSDVGVDGILAEPETHRRPLGRLDDDAEKIDPHGLGVVNRRIGDRNRQLAAAPPIAVAAAAGG